MQRLSVKIILLNNIETNKSVFFSKLKNQIRNFVLNLKLVFLLRKFSFISKYNKKKRINLKTFSLKVFCNNDKIVVNLLKKKKNNNKRVVIYK